MQPGSLVEASALKVTVKGAFPSLGVVLVKLGTGAAGTGALVTVMVLGAEVLFPPVFIAVNRYCVVTRKLEHMAWVLFSVITCEIPVTKVPAPAGCTS